MLLHVLQEEAVTHFKTAPGLLFYELQDQNKDEV